MTKQTTQKKAVSVQRLIQLSESYNRSTNLELDFKDSRKIQNIYLSTKFQEGLQDIFASVLEKNSNHRVRVLSGSPGLGKSTFALLTAQIVSKKHPRLAGRLMNQSKSALKKDFHSFQKSKGTKLLPVFINGYEGEIERVFKKKLETALFENDIYRSDLKFHTSDRLDSRFHRNDGMQPKPSETEKSNRTGRAPKTKSESNFYQNPQTGNRNADVSSKIQSATGLYKNPPDDSGKALVSIKEKNTLDFYKSSLDTLKAKGYGGIFVIYDEFGKYLERAVHNPADLNIQFLQNFAEFCNRSGEKQCHLMLVTHLSVSQYAGRLPVHVQREWEKIEGRFQESAFYDKSADDYNMISAVFKKNISETRPLTAKKYKAYIKKYLSNFKEEAFKGFIDLKSVDSILLNCFPLHPTVLSLLPRLSKKTAQNERTLYTFLTRDENNSLKQFLVEKFKNESALLMPYDLYQYFKPLIEKDIGIGGTYKIQLMAEGAFQKIRQKDESAKQIISLMALCSVIKDAFFAPLTERFIVSCFNQTFPAADIKKSLKTLRDKKVIFYNKNTKQYLLQEGSPVDIDEEIAKLKNTALTGKSLVQVIQRYFKTDFIIPKKYNFDNAIQRFYRTKMISVEELKNLKSKKTVDFYREDGLVFYVVPFSHDEWVYAKSEIKKIRHPLTVFVLPGRFIECRKDIEELNAVDFLYNNKEILSAGPLVKKELDRHKEILLTSIKSLLRPLIGRINLSAYVVYPKQDFPTGGEDLRKDYSRTGGSDEPCGKEGSLGRSGWGDPAAPPLRAPFSRPSDQSAPLSDGSESPADLKQELSNTIGIKKISHFKELQRHLGDLFEKEYSKYISFNLEYMNRHSVSGSVTLGRKKFIETLRRCKKEPCQDIKKSIEGRGPGYVILDTMLRLSRFHYSASTGACQISQESEFYRFFKEYENILSDHPRGIRGSALIDILIAPPYGLRRGVIPVFVALADLCFKQPVSHYFDSAYVKDLDGDHYDLLMKYPAKTVIHYTPIDDNQQKFLEGLSTLFTAKDGSIRSVIEALLKWRKSVPESTKKSSFLSPEGRKFLIQIDSSTEPDQLLFKDLPECFESPLINDQTAAINAPSPVINNPASASNYKSHATNDQNHAISDNSSTTKNQFSRINDISPAINNHASAINNNLPAINNQISATNNRFLTIGDQDTAINNQTSKISDNPSAINNKDHAINDQISVCQINKILSLIKKTKAEIDSVYKKLLLNIKEDLTVFITSLNKEILDGFKKRVVKNDNLIQSFQSVLKQIRHLPFSAEAERFTGRALNFDPTSHSQYFLETMADVLTGSSPRYWDKKGHAKFKFALKKIKTEMELVCEMAHPAFKGQSVLAFIDRGADKKTFLKLGAFSGKDKRLSRVTNEIKKKLNFFDEADKRKIILSILESFDKKLLEKDEYSPEPETYA